MSGMDNTTIRVNLADAADVKCDNCGDRRFEAIHLIKLLSPIISPTGKEMLVPISTWACLRCSHINELFLPMELRATTKKIEKEKSGIVSSQLPETPKEPITKSGLTLLDGGKK